MVNGEKPSVVIAGASGFVGQALAPLLAEPFHVIGLSRSERKPGGGFAKTLELRFAPERSGRDRQLFYVTGGALRFATHLAIGSARDSSLTDSARALTS